MRKHDALTAFMRCPASRDILGADLGSRLSNAAMGGPYRIDATGKKQVEHQVASLSS